jgi:anthranilate synthase/aminodeoxychorismate synthase-like glutamine amidotransferase
MSRLLLIDNYDSFTYNLYQYCSELGAKVEVYRNDAITVAEARALDPDGLIISPGPCTPREAGISNDLIEAIAGERPILGVCLGLQCMAYALGGEIIRAPELRHGKTSMVHHDGKGIFRNLPSPFEAVRYHSLVAAPESLPACLEVSARTADGLIMGVRHRELPLEGVQFHPESIMTARGKDLLRNFLDDVEFFRSSGAVSSATKR